MYSRKSAGFTLVELIISILVVSVGLAALVGSMVMATRTSADPLVRKQSAAIAEGLLEEIELKPFSNPTGGFTGAPTVSNRALFDDVSDYNNYTSAGTYAADGTPILALSTYSTRVTVVPTALGAIAAGNSKLISVIVTGPGGEVVTVAGYRTNYF